jgi:hypothetical protein
MAMALLQARMMARPPWVVNMEPMVCHSQGQYWVSISR